eukprot:scaffold307947_cov27-Tisochrysis_lutea.AAC.4
MVAELVTVNGVAIAPAPYIHWAAEHVNHAQLHSSPTFGQGFSVACRKTPSTIRPILSTSVANRKLRIPRAVFTSRRSYCAMTCRSSARIFSFSTSVKPRSLRVLAATMFSWITRRYSFSASFTAWLASFTALPCRSWKPMKAGMKQMTRAARKGLSTMSTTTRPNNCSHRHQVGLVASIQEYLRQAHDVEGEGSLHNGHETRAIHLGVFQEVGHLSLDERQRDDDHHPIDDIDGASKEEGILKELLVEPWQKGDVHRLIGDQEHAHDEGHSLVHHHPLDGPRDGGPGGRLPPLAGANTLRPQLCVCQLPSPLPPRSLGFCALVLPSAEIILRHHDALRAETLGGQSLGPTRSAAFGVTALGAMALGAMPQGGEPPVLDGAPRPLHLVLPRAITKVEARRPASHHLADERLGPLESFSVDRGVALDVTLPVPLLDLASGSLASEHRLQPVQLLGASHRFLLLLDRTRHALVQQATRARKQRAAHAGVPGLLDQLVQPMHHLGDGLAPLEGSTPPTVAPQALQHLQQVDESSRGKRRAVEHVQHRLRGTRRDDNVHLVVLRGCTCRLCEYGDCWH